MLQRARRKLRVQLVEARLIQPAGIAAVTVVGFLLCLPAGHAQLRGVHDHDVIAGVHVRRELRLVLAAEPARELDGEAAEHLVGRIDDEPVAADLVRLGGKCFHFWAMRAAGKGPNCSVPASPLSKKSAGWANRPHQKKSSLCGCSKSTKGGGWRR